MDDIERDIPEWLKKVQENSWELELLISGGAIFSLFKLSDFFFEFISNLRVTTSFGGSHFFLLFGMFGIKLLTVGFVTHLILRAFWVGQLCLSFAFPNGVQKIKKLKNTPFKDKFQIGEDLRTDLIKIDALAGLAMFLSVMSTCIIVGFLTSFLITISIPNVIFGAFFFPFGYEIILSIMYLLYIFDLLFFGLLRKVKYLSYILYPFFRFLDFITFRFLFEKSLKIFSSNINKIKALIFLIFFFLASIAFTYANVYDKMHWPNIFDQRDNRYTLAGNFKEKYISQGFYLDTFKEGERMNGSTIHSQIVGGTFLRVYIPYMKEFDSVFDKYLQSEEYKTPSQTVKLYIDEKEVDEIDWFDYKYNGGGNDQFALHTLIDISALSKGKHILEITSINREKEELIPFWKDE